MRLGKKILNVDTREGNQDPNKGNEEAQVDE